MGGYVPGVAVGAVLECAALAGCPRVGPQGSAARGGVVSSISSYAGVPFAAAVQVPGAVYSGLGAMAASVKQRL